VPCKANRSSSPRLRRKFSSHRRFEGQPGWRSPSGCDHRFVVVAPADQVLDVRRLVCHRLASRRRKGFPIASTMMFGPIGLLAFFAARRWLG